MNTQSRAVQVDYVRQGPAKIADERVGLNARIAAALTRQVGSMWTVYATLAIILTWMALQTWGPLRPIDPYPFPFMLFLGNVVQLLLCFVILVGQSVLSSAADKRAWQTYDNTRAILQEVSELQVHLDHQDHVLSRGYSLVESLPRARKVQPPPQAKDQVVTLNDRIAAWITQRAGSMWAFYVAAAIQVVWMGLAQAHVLTFDPYPYPFLLFLSSLVQLLFMIIIMVGQEVLGRAGDRRSEQTFLDAQVILAECMFMQHRLAEQDSIIFWLCDYTRKQVIEQLARAIHNSYIEACLARNEPLGSRDSLRVWDELSEKFRESNRDQARQIGEKLAMLGCDLVPTFNPSPPFAYRDGEVLRLARMEHDRWMRERQSQGFEYGPVRQGQYHPDMVPWEKLTDEAREKDIRAVRDIPQIVSEAGLQVVRLAAAG